MAQPNPLTPAQQAVLEDALRLVRDQRARALPTTPDPASAWSTPFGLGYFVGAVDGLCQVHGAPFDGTALAVLGLVLEDTFGRKLSDVLRNRALDLLEANDPDFNRGRPWGGNEAVGFARGQHAPVGLVHLAEGEENRMG